MPVQTWECEECGYLVAGTKKPSRCPECGTYNSFVLPLDDEDDLEDLEEVDEELEDPYDEEDEEEEEDEEDS